MALDSLKNRSFNFNEYASSERAVATGLAFKDSAPVDTPLDRLERKL
jgi:hypothetical protein